MLFSGMGNSIASESNREASHHFTLGANLVLFSFVICYVGGVAFRSKGREGCISRWGALVSVVFGCLLLMVDPIRHILLDHAVNGVTPIGIKERRLAMYSPHGGLSATGQFCQTTTISGMILLLVGILMHMKVPEAVVAKCVPTNTAKTM